MQNVYKTGFCLSGNCSLIGYTNGIFNDESSWKAGTI